MAASRDPSKRLIQRSPHFTPKEKVELTGVVDLIGDEFDTLIGNADPQTTHPISPDFTYVSEVLTQIDYAGGEIKTFTYGGSGELTIVDYTSNGITKRKEFFYGVGGELDYITQSYI